MSAAVPYEIALKRWGASKLSAEHRLPFDPEKVDVYLSVDGGCTGHGDGDNYCYCDGPSVSVSISGRTTENKAKCSTVQFSYTGEFVTILQEIGEFAHA